MAVARALAPRPRVLLFDEPFSNLDTGLRARIRADVAALMREVRMTSIFVTHDQEESFVVGDRVAVMREGRIMQVGRPADVYQHPASAWVATFVGEANVLGGVATNGHVSTLVGEVPLADPVRGPCRVVIRPEYLAVGRGDQGVVSAVEFYGHDTTYQLAPQRDETGGPGDRRSRLRTRRPGVRVLHRPRSRRLRGCAFLTTGCLLPARGPF